MKRFYLPFFTLLTFVTIFPIKTLKAQEKAQIVTKHVGSVVEVTKEGHVEFGSKYQELSVKLKDGREVTVINNPQMSAKSLTYKEGDKVIIQSFSIGPNEQQTYIIIDYDRTNFIKGLFVFFIAIALLVGRKNSFYSLLGMSFSFFVIFKFILPEIISGSSPLATTILASVFIIPVTFYLSHGFNKKTHVAMLSTVITLIFTALLANFSVNTAKLTGYASEEAMFLQVANQTINMKGILLSGIIIGFLGILDDVTISQSSIVSQLRKTKRGYTNIELYKDAMNVGRDHISSMINTLVLVYSGASMPLLLLFINNPQPLVEVINTEIIADEIIRTLVGSIGLILAVPLSTLIASFLPEEKRS